MKYLKVTIKKPWGTGDDVVQRVETVTLHTDFTIFDFVKNIIKNIGEPYRFYIDLSLICTAGKLIHE